MGINQPLGSSAKVAVIIGMIILIFIIAFGVAFSTCSIPIESPAAVLINSCAFSVCKNHESTVIGSLCDYSYLCAPSGAVALAAEKGETK